MRRATIAACAAAALAAAGLALPGAASAAKRLPPTWDLGKPAKILGRTPEEWTIEWWQWCYALPVAHHPLWESTGELAPVAQRGKVWFVGGAFNSSSVNRTITVPEDVSLLFPVTNAQWDSSGLAAPLSIDELRSLLGDYMSAVETDSMFAELDGSRLAPGAIARVPTEAFLFTFPEDNVGMSLGLPTPRGVYYPTVADGYWLMLRPLAAGRHTLAFFAEVGPPYSFTLDVTYTIDVVPVQSH